MLRLGSRKAKLFLSRVTKQSARSLRNMILTDQMNEVIRDPIDHEDVEEKKPNLPSWIPHSRTGIYYPTGHEQVMHDVPDGAASFGQTYWLRNVEGVEKPFLDGSSFEHPVI
ncbi:hypothetical protein MKW94_028120 [Papaver nudicaule]|uniref:Late embryogenesis abundant protein n=1 Tax=Papaver nudicaule TaxID=74823 RepID=A0AA41S6S2_PAPNU|nr:hypothetical protein [Papaver nudicaule]